MVESVFFSEIGWSQNLNGNSRFLKRTFRKIKWSGVLIENVYNFTDLCQLLLSVMMNSYC